MQNDSRRARATRTAMITMFAGASLALPASADHTIRRPQPRQNHTAFALGHGQMVILGGESDTGALAEEWIRRDGHWHYRPTAFSARFDQAVTVLDDQECGQDDRRPERIIMTGGTNEAGEVFDGIWRRDRRSGDWILIGRNELGRRSGHTALPGPRGRSILIFGGQRDGQKLSDTVRMTFDRYGFPQLALEATNGIPARDQHTMTWVPSIRRIIVQGGRGEGDVALSDTYYWDNDHGWIRIADAPFAARFNHTIYWDEKAKRLVAIGGTDGTQDFSDAWVARPRRDQRHVIIDWVKLTDDAVGAREGHSVVYNERRRRAVVFGGKNADGFLGDTYKVKVERTSYGTPTVDAYIVDDYTQDGDPVTSESTADFDHDGVVDLSDVLSIYASFGACVGCPHDLNGSGYVDATDVAVALAQLGAN